MGTLSSVRVTLELKFGAHIEVGRSAEPLEESSCGTYSPGSRTTKAQSAVWAPSSALKRLVPDGTCVG